jgi:hypothetical protein
MHTPFNPPTTAPKITADAEADGEDHVKIVVLDISHYLSGALRSNYSEFPNSWPGCQFALGVDAFQMLIRGGHSDLI